MQCACECDSEDLCCVKCCIPLYTFTTLQYACESESEILCCVQCCILQYTFTSVQCAIEYAVKSRVVCSVLYNCILLHMCSVPLTATVKSCTMYSVVNCSILLHLCSLPRTVTVKVCAILLHLCSLLPTVILKCFAVCSVVYCFKLLNPVQSANDCDTEELCFLHFVYCCILLYLCTVLVTVTVKSNAL